MIKLKVYSGGLFINCKHCDGTGKIKKPIEYYRAYCPDCDGGSQCETCGGIGEVAKPFDCDDPYYDDPYMDCPTCKNFCGDYTLHLGDFDFNNLDEMINLFKQKNET